MKVAQTVIVMLCQWFHYMADIDALKEQSPVRHAQRLKCLY